MLIASLLLQVFTGLEVNSPLNCVPNSTGKLICTPASPNPCATPPPANELCTADKRCGCYQSKDEGCTWIKREPCPGPSPSPTPPIPSPSPGVCAFGTNVPHSSETGNKCLEAPPAISCAALPDDPPGLLRDGFGCDAKGGTGTGIIRVSVIGPDGAVGSLRWAYDQVNANNRRVVFDAISGEIILNTPLYWKKPYSTIDFSASDVTIRNKQDGKDGLVFTATHNLIVYSGRGKGNFAGGGPEWKQQNNSGNFTLDGDGSPFKFSWDDKYDSASYYERRGVRNSIFDRNTVSHCSDDCLASWMGVHDVSFTRNFIYYSFHPTTLGANGMPLQKDRERLRISYRYNVWLDNGERQVVSRRETYYLVYDNNIVMNWREYISNVCQAFDPNDSSKCISWAVESNWPYGFHFATQAPLENDFNWVTNNCFIPLPSGLHKDWGGVVENLGCEDPTCCAPNCTNYSGKNIQCCNKPMKNTHWAMWNNTGAAIEVNRNNPPDWIPPALPFPLNEVSREKILSEVGVVRRNSSEQALIDSVLANLNKCTIP